MRLIILLITLLVYSTTYSQGIEGRQKTAKIIMKVYHESCMTKSGNVKQVFELAATYILHGEYNNMKEQLLEARSISKNTKCHNAIDDFLNL
jgi:hypothetical protein